MNFFVKKTKLLVYGSKGWIGGLFLNYLRTNFPNIKIVEGLFRMDSEYIDSEIKKVNPTNVISFIGRTHGIVDSIKINTIDYLEYPGKLVENVRDNLYGPMNVASICTSLGIHFMYIGTGCIFNNVSDEVYTENSVPNYFGSSYSVVKGFTDRMMDFYPNVLNIRIRMPIHSEHNERNFITKITKYSKICSTSNSMTVLDDFFPIFVDMLIKRKKGTYNCTNPGYITHDEILSVYRDTTDPNFKWENMTIEEQSKILKSSRSNNHLDTSKIKKEYPKLLNIHESISVIMKKLC